MNGPELQKSEFSFQITQMVDEGSNLLELILKTSSKVITRPKLVALSFQRSDFERVVFAPTASVGFLYWRF